MAQSTLRPTRETRHDSPPGGGAWQPLSFAGVAAFARATRTRLLVMQLVVALCCSGCLLWFLQTAWVPVMEKALMELPEQGGIEEGTLRWGGEPSVVLDYNSYLSVAVNLDGGAGRQEVSDVQLSLLRRGARLDTLFGRIELPYGQGWHLPLTRKELEPWWLAWQPAFAVLSLGGFALLLVGTWTLLSVFYALPAGLLSGLLRRDCTWSGVRRLCGAALVPGGIFLGLAFLFYGAGRLNFMGLSLAFALHWAVGWVYALGGIVRLPAAAKSGKTGSPFVEAPAPGLARQRRSSNPFQS